MKNQEEVEAAIAACEAENKRLSQIAHEQYALPYHKRAPWHDIEENVRLSRANNITISALKWLLSDLPESPAWILPHPA